MAPLVFLVALVVALGAQAGLAVGTEQSGRAGASGCANADAQTGSASLTSEAKAFVCLINAERARRGLSQLTACRALGRAAHSHSREMVRRHYFGHERRGGLSFYQRMKKSGYLSGSWAVGENIGWGAGSQSTPSTIVDIWMSSDEHRANVLDRAYRQIGIGLARGKPFGSGRRSRNRVSNGLVVTADFGRHG